jgi:hypothetical protein
MYVRRGATVLSVALVLGVAVAPPARAVAGPVPVDTHDAAQPVYDLSSDPTGTVFVTTGGAVRLLRAPVTPGSPEIALGTRGPGPAAYPGQEVSIVGGRVAIPQLPSATAFATSVKTCLVDDCPTTTTFTFASGYRYLGNAGDAAILHNPSSDTLALKPWAGGTTKLVSLAAFSYEPLGAYGDATGVALWNGTRAAYVARSTGTVTTLAGARRPYLTPSYVVAVGTTEVLASDYTIQRVPRSNPAATPVVEAHIAESIYFGADPIRLAATDTAAAWTPPLAWPDKNSGAPELGRLFTVPFDGSPHESGRAEWSAVTPFQGTSDFLVHRDGPSGRGFYRVTPSGVATLVHALPPVHAKARSIWVSDGRVAYADDSLVGGAAYVRDVPGGVPGPETLIRQVATDVAVSGPYVAVSSDGDFPDAGRLGAGYLSSIASYTDDLRLSGYRVLTQAARDLELTPLAGTGRSTRLGNLSGTIFGDVLVTADGNGMVRRRNLLTGATTTVRSGTCGGDCGHDRSTWQLAAWGDDVVYALDLGSHGRVSGLWNAATGTTTALPMLANGWDRLAYRDGLLLLDRAGVDLYDVRHGTHAVVDATGSLPPGQGLDGTLVAWAEASGRAVVAQLTDYLPSYVPTPIHVNALVPPGFGPGISPGGRWDAELYVSDDVSWQATFRQGSTGGPLVRTLSGSSDHGTVAPAWDGTDETGDPMPQGWYYWRLSGDAPTKTGRTYLSRIAPPAPALNVPTLVSDVSANGAFTITWSGATPDDHYELTGPAGRISTTATARSYRYAGPQTYHFSLVVVDPAGRRSEPAEATTVSPHDDTEANATGHWSRVTDDRHWQGSQLRSTTAGDRAGIYLRGNGVWVVGPRGPGYGRYRVTVDGRSWTYDAYSPTIRFRQVLFKLGGLADRTHHVVVEVLATSGRTRVGVDAIGVRVPERYGH